MTYFWAIAESAEESEDDLRLTVRESIARDYESGDSGDFDQWVDG